MDTNQQYDEKALLSQIAAGDEQAFTSFFYLYKDRFYSVVLKMTRSDVVAEEIVQDVFLNIWQKRELLVTIENPSSYFFTAVYRRVYTYYRKLALENKLVKEISGENNSVNATEETIIARESERIINDAIAKLPPQQQLVYKLSREEGLSREQIATQLNISPNTVKNHLMAAIKFLRAYLKTPVLLLLIYWYLKK